MTKGTLVVGRFSGFHRGHVALIQKAHADHPDNIIIVGIVVGKKSSMDVNKNPFTFEQRKEMIEKILRAINIDAFIIQLASAYIPDVVSLLKEKYNIEIEYVYCGSDRLNGYVQQGLENLGVKIVYVERDENDITDPTRMASATKIREALKNRDFELFKNLLPNEIDEDVLIDIWNMLRSAMKEKGISVSSSLVSGITHLEELDLDEFIYFVKNFYNENIIAIQKLDGTINMSVVRDDEGIYFARLSKKQPEPFTANDLPKNPIFNGLRGACIFLSNEIVKSKLIKLLDPGDALDIEVLYGSQPNTIRYNLKNNYLAILRFIQGKSGDEAERILDEIVEELKTIKVNIKNPVYYYDWNTESIEYKLQSEVWKFTKPEVLDKAKFKYDVQKDLEILTSWLSDTNTIIPSMTNLEVLGVALTSIPKNERPLYKQAKLAAEEEANKLKLNIKQRMIDVILKHADFELGGNEQEGLVIRDKDTGKMTKLIDKEGFTKANQTNWRYMELAMDGMKVDGEFVPGVVSKFFSLNADILNIPMLKLRNKLFKQFRNGNSSYIQNILNYLYSNDISSNNIKEKLILLKNSAINSLKEIKKLNEEAMLDDKLNDHVKKRTSDSLGLIYNNFKTYISEVDKLINESDTNDNILAKYIFLLMKTFSRVDE